MLARSLLRQLTTPEVVGLADALTAASAAVRGARPPAHRARARRCGPAQVTAEDRAAVSATDNAMATGYSFYLLALPP